MLADFEYIAFRVVAQEQICLRVGPSGRRVIDVSTETYSQSTRVADASHWEAQPESSRTGDALSRHAGEGDARECVIPA
jgi:hypothetical protein